MSHTSSAQQHDLIAFLSTNPDGTVEDIAKRYDVTPLEVIRLIPTAQVLMAHSLIRFGMILPSGAMSLRW